MAKPTSKIDKKACGLGIKAGLIASLCCLIPLVLIIFGLASASITLKLVQYKPYFIIASLIFLVASLWYFFKKRACCLPEGKLNKKWFIGTAFGVYLLTFWLLLYVLTPSISPFLYNLPSQKSGAQGTNKPLSQQQLTLKISGMTCSSCAIVIEYNLENLPGVSEAKVEYPKGDGRVIYNPQLVTLGKIIETIKPYEVIVVSEE